MYKGKIYKKQYKLIAEYLGEYHFCDCSNITLIDWTDEEKFPLDYKPAWPDKPSIMFDYKILFRYKEIERISLIDKIRNFFKKN